MGGFWRRRRARVNEAQIGGFFPATICGLFRPASRLFQILSHSLRIRELAARRSRNRCASPALSRPRLRLDNSARPNEKTRAKLEVKAAAAAAKLLLIVPASRSPAPSKWNIYTYEMILPLAARANSARVGLFRWARGVSKLAGIASSGGTLGRQAVAQSQLEARGLQ